MARRFKLHRRRMDGLKLPHEKQLDILRDATAAAAEYADDRTLGLPRTVSELPMSNFPPFEARHATLWACEVVSSSCLPLPTRIRVMARDTIGLRLP